jgi:hypothetical protein
MTPERSIDSGESAGPLPPIAEWITAPRPILAQLTAEPTTMPPITIDATAPSPVVSPMSAATLIVIAIMMPSMTGGLKVNTNKAVRTTSTIKAIFASLMAWRT